MDRRGRKTCPFGWLGDWKLSQKDWKESGVPSGGWEGLEGVGRPYQRAGRGLVGPGELGNLSQRDGRGRKAFPEGRERLGGPPGGPRGVRRPSERAGRGWEALPKIHEGSGGLGEVGSLSWRVERGFESLPEEREGLRGPSRGMGGVRRSFGRAEWGREGRVGSGGPPGRPGRVGRPSRRARRNQEGRKRLGVSPGEAFLEGRARLVGPPDGLGGVWRPSQSAGRSWEALLVGREGWGGLGGVGRPSRRARQCPGRSGGAGRPIWMAVGV